VQRPGFFVSKRQEKWAFPFGAGFAFLLLAATLQDVGCGIIVAIPNAVGGGCFNTVVCVE